MLVIALMGTVVIKEWDTLVKFPWHLDVKYFILMIIFHSFALGVTFLVWHLMISRLGRFSDKKVNFRFYYVSTLAKRVPTALWYVGGRLAMYQQVRVSIPAVLSCIFLEYVTIGIAGIATFLALFPFYSQLPKMGWVLWVLISSGLAVTIGLLTKPRMVIDIANKVLERFQKQKIDAVPTRKDILVWEGLYILPWFFAGLSLYCAIKAFYGPIGIGIVDAIGISTLSMLIALLSMVFPSGFGLKEVTSSVLLSHWLPLPFAIVISVAYRLVQTTNEVIWALVAITLFTSPSFNYPNNTKGLFKSNKNEV